MGKQRRLVHVDIQINGTKRSLCSINCMYLGYKTPTFDTVCNLYNMPLAHVHGKAHRCLDCILGDK